MTLQEKIIKLLDDINEERVTFDNIIEYSDSFYKGDSDFKKVVNEALNLGLISGISIKGNCYSKINPGLMLTFKGEETLKPKEPFKVEITNFSELGLNPETISLLLTHKRDIKELLEQLVFLSADNIEIAKMALEKEQKTKGIDLNNIINLLTTMIPFTVSK